MPIPFTQINTDSRLPSVRLEISNRLAVDSVNQVEKLVAIGQRTAAGSAIEGEVVTVTSKEDAQEFFGVGSQLADMLEYFLVNNANMSITAIALDDDGTNAEKTITVTGTATSAATLSVWVAGRFVRVPVNIGDTADTIAASIEAAIDADPELLFGASVASNVVTLVSLNEGAWTEDLVVQGS